MKRILFLILVVTSLSAKASPQIKDTLNVDNLRLSIYSLPFKYKGIVLAQAILETGWFKSDNCLKNNNLFGMKRVHARVTTSDTTINGYAHYSNWNMSVIDYYILNSVTQDIIPSRTKEEYYHYLDRIYSEVGKSYSSQIKNIVDRLAVLYPDDPNFDLDTHNVSHSNNKHHKKQKHK